MLGRMRPPVLLLLTLAAVPLRADRLLVPRIEARPRLSQVRTGATYHSPYLLGYLENRQVGTRTSSRVDFLVRNRMVSWQEVAPFDRVATTVEHLYRDKDWRVRRAAVDELLWYPSERVEEALIRALRDPVLAVRDAAVKALAHVGTNRSLDPLMQAMRDTPGPVRDSIALTLRKLTGEDYGRHLDRWRSWQQANRDALR